MSGAGLTLWYPPGGVSIEAVSKVLGGRARRLGSGKTVGDDAEFSVAGAAGLLSASVTSWPAKRRTSAWLRAFREQMGWIPTLRLEVWAVSRRDAHHLAQAVEQIARNLGGWLMWDDFEGGRSALPPGAADQQLRTILVPGDWPGAMDQHVYVLPIRDNAAAWVSR